MSRFPSQFIRLSSNQLAVTNHVAGDADEVSGNATASVNDVSETEGQSSPAVVGDKLETAVVSDTPVTGATSAADTTESGAVAADVSSEPKEIMGFRFVFT